MRDGEEETDEDEDIKTALVDAWAKLAKVVAMTEHRTDLGSAMHYHMGVSVESIERLYEIASLKYGDGRG